MELVGLGVERNSAFLDHQLILAYELIYFILFRLKAHLTSFYAPCTYLIVLILEHFVFGFGILFVASGHGCLSPCYSAHY